MGYNSNRMDVNSLDKFFRNMGIVVYEDVLTQFINIVGNNWTQNAQLEVSDLDREYQLWKKDKE